MSVFLGSGFLQQRNVDIVVMKLFLDNEVPGVMVVERENIGGGYVEKNDRVTGL